MIFTIGHTIQSLDDFYDMLQHYDINCIIDVRSMPFSKHAPQFNKESLCLYLKSKSVLYAHFGKEFGARRDDCLQYVHNGNEDFMQVNFELGVNTDNFKAGINRLDKALSQNRTIALMCTEANPLDCHRFSFISRYLYDNKYEIMHIIRDKETYEIQLKTHKELEARMINEYVRKGKLWDIGGLFAELNDEKKQREEAYRIKNREIGYKPAMEEIVID